METKPVDLRSVGGSLATTSTGPTPRPVTLYRRQLDALSKVDEARIRAEAAHVAFLAADAEQDAANQAYNEARYELEQLIKIGAA